MKDLEQRDILNRQVLPYTKLTVYHNGKWNFQPLDLFTRTTDPDGVTYYRITSPFGLVRQDGINPKTPTFTGKAGDYVAMNISGGLAVVTKEQYDLFFPKKKLTKEEQPVNSKALRDPNYITNILKDS